MDLTLVATTNHLSPYLVVSDRWVVSSAPIVLLGLLWSSLGQSLVELMLQLKETKQIKLNLNNNKYNKLKVLKTKIKYLRTWPRIKHQPTGICPTSDCGSPRIAFPE